MKHTTKILTLFGALLISTSAWAVDATYYTSLDGQSGKNLFDAIHAVANTGFKQLSYSDLWTAYEKTDLYPAGHANAGKIWDMYSNCIFTSITDKDPGSGSTECQYYNREHSIPKSWFCDCTTGMGADLFHLVPTDKIVNNERSSYAFGEVASATYTYDNSKSGTAKNITVTNTVLGSSFTTSSVPTKVFEPADEYKGDFARGYFGTMIKWTTGYTMSSGDGKWFFNNTYTEGGHFGLADYGIALLMKWHRQDPVSQKEIDRNNGIQATQGNRNPFIDYPCLAEYLWGEKAGEAFNTASCCGSFEANFSVGSDGCTACTTTSDPLAPTITVSQSAVNCESVYVGNTGNATFKVSGSNLTADITLSITGDGFSINKTTLTQTAGTVAETTITVTFAPTAAGEYSGTITISSGTTTQTVTVTGSGTTGTIGTAPESKPTIYFGTVVTDALTVSGATATLNLHISDLATDVTVASSNTGIFTVSTNTANDGTVTPEDAAAGVTITLTKVKSGTANLTIKGGVVDKTYKIIFQ